MQGETRLGSCLRGDQPGGKLLCEREIEIGVRLACLTRILGETMEVEARGNRAAQILVRGIDYDTELLPNVRKTYVELEPPSLYDQRDDLKRLQNSLGGAYSVSRDELIKLPQVRRKSEFRVTAVHDRSHIVAVESGDTRTMNYGVAVDVGTTTVVAYLIDLVTGKQVDVASGLNPQKTHGQDVISRISYTIQHPEGLDRHRNQRRDRDRKS